MLPKSTNCLQVTDDDRVMSSNPVQDLQSSKPKDFVIFVNLVEFSRYSTISLDQPCDHVLKCSKMNPWSSSHAIVWQLCFLC